MDSSSIGKWLLIIGAVIVILGLIVWSLGKVGIPFGKLPGDFYYKGENYSVYFPLVSGLILSIFLTFVINLLFWLFRE